MQIGKKFRECDKFGAQVQLMYQGDTERGTLCGGLISFCLTTLTLAYFCISMADVAQYANPNISSYTVFEDRSKMDEPINLEDSG